MAKVNQNHQKFILLKDRYKKACRAIDQKPDDFYYEKGYVKCNGMKSKRVATFEKMVVNLEEKVTEYLNKGETKHDQLNTEDSESRYNDTTPKKKWYHKFLFWR